MAPVVGEASSSSPPSTSIPPRPRSCTYDVFLSFSGKDTRNTFIGHLDDALERKGIKTFRDDKDLERGEVIKDELLKAIKESMFAVIVLSPNYASSSWCLVELNKIVKCSKSQGLEVVPVFYGGVEPSDVRHQKGSFGEAFKKHEERFGPNSEKIRTWRGALTEVANHSGWDSKVYKHEAALVESIADHIHKKWIPKLPSSTKNLVGIASRVEEVMRHIGIGLDDDVRSIGIWGMGGIGKTTIATAVYEAIQGEFTVSCFLRNVREACEGNNTVQKQKELLDKANISASAIYDEFEGRRVIQNSLCNKKVLLVLDDISDEVQLRNLAGEQDWFGLGSRIIITTRDSHLLEIYEAHGTCEVRGLDDNDSSDLFCLKAFKKEKPDEKYLDLTKEVVKYSGGLPLALEVLGSYLHGKSVDVWRDAIEKIKSTLDAKIHKTLRISYNSLDVIEKDIFLDIACFFKGWEEDDVTKLLESCGYKGVRIGINILIDKSLVKINEKYNSMSKKYNVLEMHDLLQEMGRSIVTQESPNNHGQRSRLWYEEHIDLVLANNKGSEAIQSIVSWPVSWSARFVRHWNAEAFSNMTQLKLLIINSWPGGENRELCDLSSLPTSLKVLRWLRYPLKTLPLSDQHYELVEIRLEGSLIENLWHGKKFLGMLKHLDLSGSGQLKQTPDLSGVPILETLLLKNCRNLTEVHLSVVQHKRLTLLDLFCCCRLKTLPGKLEMSSLKELSLACCSSFKILPEFGECMENLSRLCLVGTSIKKLPTSLGCLVGLQDLNLFLCRKLECLPNITGGLPSLRTLGLGDCRLKSFPPDFGPFPCLTDLKLSENDFVSLPRNIHDIPKLKRLYLDRCEKLQCLPELPSSIRELQAWACRSLDISEFNILSTVCGAFVSPSRDPDQVLLEMMIPGSKIPSWFVHRQDGNSVSIPCDYPPNERLGIALCFLPICETSSKTSSGKTCIESVPDGNIFNTIRVTSRHLGGNHLHIICLTNDCFSDEFHRGTCLEICFDFGAGEVISMTTAARYVSKEDIKDLEKRVIERPPKNKKHKKNV